MEQEAKNILNILILIPVIGIVILSFLQVAGYSYFLMYLCLSINICIVYKLRSQITTIDLVLIAITIWETVDLISNRCYNVSLLYNSLLALYAYFTFKYLKGKYYDILENSVVIIAFIFIIFGLVYQYKQYAEIHSVGFSFVYPFRYLVKPIGFLINVWATITLLLLNLFGYLIIKEDRPKVTLYAAYFLCLITLLLSFSRAGSFLATISIVLLFYCTKWEKFKYLFVGCLIVYFIVFLFFYREFLASFSLIGDTLQQNSSLGRMEATYTIFKYIKDHPLIGYGIGNYLETVDGILFQDVMSYTSYAPNLLSLYIVERGLIGIIPLCLLLFILFNMLFRKDINNANRYLIAMIFFVIIKEMSLATIQYNPIVKILLYIQFGLLPKQCNIINTKYAHRFVCILLVCSYFVCSVFTYIQKVYADVNSIALEAYKKKNYKYASICLANVPLLTPFVINKRMVIINQGHYYHPNNDIDNKIKTSMLLKYTTYKLYKKNVNYRDSASTCLKHCLQLYPQNVLFKYLAYKEYYQEGNFLLSAIYLSDAIFLMPSIIESTDVKYSLKHSVIFHSELNRLVKKKLDSYSISAKDLAYKGYIYYNMGNLEKAKAFLLKAIEIQPNLSVPYYLLSKIYRKENEHEKYIVNKNKYRFLTKREKPLTFKEMQAYSTEEILLFYCFSQKFKKMYEIDFFTHIN